MEEGGEPQRSRPELRTTTFTHDRGDPVTKAADQPTPPRADHTDSMFARFAMLGDAETWDDLPDGTREQWEAPYGPGEEWSVSAEDRHLPGPHGPVPVRIYTPQTEPSRGPRPCLVWCHGGSFMHGDLDMPEGDHVSRGVAGRAGAVVISVDYRLCDEPPEIGGAKARRLPGEDFEVRAPIPLDDVCAAVDWARSHAEQLGIDPSRLAIGGSSAGGNLAAAASLRLAHEGRAPAASLLMYPVTHPLNPEPTAEEQEALAQTPGPLRFLPAAMRVMSENYTGRPVTEAVPYEFPGLATTEQLAVLPRTYIQADEFDDLRIGARRYAEQLKEAGVDVEYVVRRGVAHGHLNRVGLPAARESMDRMARLIEEL